MFIVLYHNTNCWHLRSKQQMQYQFYKKINLQCYITNLSVWIFPNLKFQVLKNQIDVLESLVDPQSSTQWLFLNHGTLPRSKRNGESCTFFFFFSGDRRQLGGKDLEILTSKGIFMGFPSSLSDLSPLKAQVT